jgi:DNA-directed RNA polymerase alpha subunit
VTPLQDIKGPLGNRAYNALRRNHIDTVEQLLALTDDELMMISNFGVACLRRVYLAIAEYTLSDLAQFASNPPTATWDRR